MLQARVQPLSDGLLASAPRGEPLPVTGGITGPHGDELPLGRDVVTFR